MQHDIRCLIAERLLEEALNIMPPPEQQHLAASLIEYYRRIGFVKEKAAAVTLTQGSPNDTKEI